MKDILYRKLAAWPQRDTAERKSRSTFSVGYADTLKQIEYELDRIDATDVVLEGFIPPTACRRDGWPKAEVNVIHPGLRLSWQSVLVGPGELMTDEYQTWPANLRAIGLTLEALRAVGRYGAMSKKQQYKGLLDAPPKTKPVPVQADNHLDLAAELIALSAGAGRAIAPEILYDAETLDYYYRLAAKLVHPDTGGDHNKFVRLQQAKEMLDKHHSKGKPK